MQIVDVTQKLRDSKDVQFVDELLKLKRQGKHWRAIDLIISDWTRRNPHKFKSFLIEVKNKRDTRLNKFGSDKGNNLRSLLDIPEDVIFMIRKLYDTSELSMDKEFFEQMYKKYPSMRASKTI